MAALSSKAFGSLLNKFQYQGSYSEYDDETGYDEFALRNYDPQRGQWTGVDPYDEFPSPYTGMGNDPINNTDPSGGGIIDGGDLPGVVVTSVARHSAVLLTSSLVARTITTLGPLMYRYMNSDGYEFRTQQNFGVATDYLDDHWRYIGMEQDQYQRTEYVRDNTVDAQKQLTELYAKQQFHYAGSTGGNGLVFINGLEQSFVKHSPTALGNDEYLSQGLFYAATGFSGFVRGGAAEVAETGVGATVDFVAGVEAKSFGKVVGSGTVNVRSTINGIENGSLKLYNYANLEGHPQLLEKPFGYWQKTSKMVGYGKSSPLRIIKGQQGEYFLSPDHFTTPGNLIPLNH